MNPVSLSELSVQETLISELETAWAFNPEGDDGGTGSGPLGLQETIIRIIVIVTVIKVRILDIGFSFLEWF
jgi:hypothetical protein